MLTIFVLYLDSIVTIDSLENIEFDIHRQLTDKP